MSFGGWSKDLRDQGLADEVLQTVFGRLIEKADSIRDDVRLSSLCRSERSDSGETAQARDSERSTVQSCS